MQAHFAATLTKYVAAHPRSPRRLHAYQFGTQLKNRRLLDARRLALNVGELVPALALVQSKRSVRAPPMCAPPTRFLGSAQSTPVAQIPAVVRPLIACVIHALLTSIEVHSSGCVRERRSQLCTSAALSESLLTTSKTHPSSVITFYRPDVISMAIDT